MAVSDSFILYISGYGAYAPLLCDPARLQGRMKASQVPAEYVHASMGSRALAGLSAASPYRWRTCCLRPSWRPPAARITILSVL